MSIAVGDRLKFRRRTLTPPEQARLLELGKLLSHALEATGRNLTLGASEEEVAGQLSHRLVHHGVEPVSLTVVADGRNRADRRPGFTPAKVNLHCTISAFARLHGLHAVSARTICFGSMDDELRQEFDAASRVLAQRVSVSVAGATVQEVFDLGQVVAVEAGFPHEWRQCSAGFITGWLPVEQTLTPTTTDRLQIGWPLVLQVSIGTALCVETYVVTDQNPRYITVPEFWPVKHVRIQGQSIVVPDVLVRDG